mgnify:CR=1 FL=1
MASPVEVSDTPATNSEESTSPTFFTHTRGRTVSDMMSGMAITRSEHKAYQNFTDEQLEAHFTRFKQYDLDDSGFVTPENLADIFKALDMPDVTQLQCVNMIEEVAILVGHDNDGKLSFRDYCMIITYEQEKQATNDAADAAEELRDSLREEEPAEDGDVLPPVLRMRGSSFAVLDTIAISRIQRFEQTIQEEVKKESADPMQVIKQQRFANKLAKFKSIESGSATVTVAEISHKATLKSKLAAFEAANKKDPIHIKRTWKNARAGTWHAKTEIAGGPAPKKTLADLP